MRLNLQGIRNTEEWTEKGYEMPQFDIEKVWAETKENPFWIHFGAGNLFRAFHAGVVQNLLNQGVLDRGLIVAEGFDYEIIEKLYKPCDNLTIDVTLKADGTISKAVIASIAEALPLDSDDKKSYQRLTDIFGKDSLQMATFTITEKGYSLVNARGEILSDVKRDFEEGSQNPHSYMGKVTALLYARYLAGQKPIAMVSTDNCSHNGDKLKAAIDTFAKGWIKNGKIDPGFENYINSEKVSFTWSMIDKITPRPDPFVESVLKADGVENVEPVITARKTYAAPFVNSEETEYLIIEDRFPNGREKLEKGGLVFTDREKVDKVEKMKVCTCLNPLHTALAIFGCLLGYNKIADEMKDPQLVNLIKQIGYQEGLPVVTDPGIINPKDFIDTVIHVRLTNTFMPDTPQRIATDTSQKLAIRFGETIKAYMESKELESSSLRMIPLVFAGWIRYLMGVDDSGKKMELSPGPMLETLCPYAEKLELGSNQDVEKIIGDILKMDQIFGVDLYKAGLAEKVCTYLKEMLTGTGAVRNTLKEYLPE